jgi:glucose-6-phosphate-specific signal transduction histidine kinase
VSGAFVRFTPSSGRNCVTILPPHMPLTPSPFVGRIWHLSLAVSCVLLVAVSAFVKPTTRECGTVLYFLIHLVAALPALVIKSVWQLNDARRILDIIATLTYIAVFGGIASVWYLKGPQKWWAVGMLGHTVLWVSAYFFLLPTTSCF